VQSGVTLHELMLLGGWRSFSMVLRYAHFAPNHLARAAAKVSLKRRTKTCTLKSSPKNTLVPIDFGGERGTRTLDLGIMSADM
jgi:hypothetical protein